MLPVHCPLPLQFYDAHELAWGMFFRDGRTGAKWMCPAMINACCMPWKDYTQLRMGVENGDAFRVRAVHSTVWPLSCLQQLSSLTRIAC